MQGQLAYSVGESLYSLPYIEEQSHQSLKSLECFSKTYFTMVSEASLPRQLVFDQAGVLSLRCQVVD